MKKIFLSFFSSLKLTVALLIIIAAASILGTVIPQQYGAAGPPANLSPGLAKAFEYFQLFDLYHSIWFVILMVLLSLNLIVCSLKRIPAAWRLYSDTPSPDREKPFQNLAQDRRLKADKDAGEVVEDIYSTLSRRYKRTGRKDKDDVTYFYGEKGAYSNFGVYIVHLSVLVIITGAIIGSLFGFDGFVNIPEGDSADVVYLGGQKGVKKLGFTVRCDDFSIDFYENGMPKEYKSQLSFIKRGEVVFQGPLLVNHPITFEEIRFYQASYGHTSEGKARIRLTDGGGDNHIVEAGPGESFSLGQTGAQVDVLRVEGNFMSMGPAVLLGISPLEGERVQIWVFKNIERIKQAVPDLFRKVPKFNPGLYSPYTFKLEGLKKGYYTGLQVSHDPGVLIAGIGALIIISGLFITFFASHRRIWIRVKREEGACEIEFAGKSNKDPAGLERELKKIKDGIKSRHLA